MVNIDTLDKISLAIEKMDIAQTLLSDFMDDHLEKDLNTVSENNAAFLFYRQRNTMLYKAIAFMEFYTQAYQSLNAAYNALNSEQTANKQ